MFLSWKDKKALREENRSLRDDFEFFCHKITANIAKLNLIIYRKFTANLFAERGINRYFRTYILLLKIPRKYWRKRVRIELTGARTADARLDLKSRNRLLLVRLLLGFGRNM